MTKINALRRFLLPCLHPTATSPIHPSSTIGHTQKKRISTSLRDDVDDQIQQQRGSQGEEDVSEPPTPTPTATSLLAPPRSSKTMVIGTIFGHRRGGHVWFCVHHDRLSIKPTLLLELSIPTTTLIQEMSCGLVRIALEFKDDSGESELSRCPLHSVPVWNLYCNGRKLGFALRKKLNQQNRLLLKTMQSITVGAGVIPSGFASGFGSGSEELMYMRANYECVIGSADSESFHLINPDEGLGQELSVFLLRTR